MIPPEKCQPFRNLIGYRAKLEIIYTVVNTLMEMKYFSSIFETLFGPTTGQIHENANSWSIKHFKKARKMFHFYQGIVVDFHNY